MATVVAAGITVFEARKAYTQLKSEGINIRVIDAYSVKPIDAATLTDAAKATKGVVITVEDHYAAGGIGDGHGSTVPASDSARATTARRHGAFGARTP